MSSWLDGARADPRGLLIPGGPDGHGADLVLTPEQVLVTHRYTLAHLEWAPFGSRRNRTDDDGGWLLRTGLNGPPTIGVSGPPTLHEVMMSTMPLVRRLAGKPYAIGAGAVLPLWVVQHQTLWASWQLDSASALLGLLRDRPDLRLKLTDGSVMARLAGDLKHKPGHHGSAPTLSPSAAAVAQTLTALGYRFPSGRPMPWDVKDPLDVVLGNVMQRLAHNPWGGAKISSKRATEVISKQYLDVEPWPFAALAG